MTMKEGIKLAILSVYQPPHKQSLKGTININSQKKRQILKADILRSIKRQFRRDLNEVIREYSRTGYQLIMCGHFNEHMTTHNIVGDILDIHKLCNISQKIGLSETVTYSQERQVLVKRYTTG